MVVREGERRREEWEKAGEWREHESKREGWEIGEETETEIVVEIVIAAGVGIGTTEGKGADQ